jgi:ABC-2 type transport system ATP-binding protein
MNAPTVELAMLGRKFRNTAALTDVDLTLRTGITGVLGPNGAGKTTLLRILATVLSADAGRVRLLGRDPDSISERTEIRRLLGYLPQDMGFPRGFTAFRFVDYMAVLKEWTRRSTRHDEVRRVLDLVDLGALSTKRIRTLSGGQRRRVAVAQALLGAPQLIVLDEPTTGLDPEQRASLRQVLSRVGERATMVLATHQTEDVAALCERVIVMHSGRVRYDGAVGDFAATAAGGVWLADSPDPAARTSWRTGSGLVRNVGTAPPGARLVEPTIEDAYLLLLGGRSTAQEAVA